MKVIYLDLDGVANNYGLSQNWERPDGSIQKPVKGTQETFGGTMGFDYDKIQRLNHIFDICDWSIVISSSWGLSQNTLGALIKFGFKYNHRIVGEISRIPEGRGTQILNHFDTYSNITDFITIEDEPHDIMGKHHSVTDTHRERFKNRVFSPNPYEGIQNTLTNHIISHIKRLEN